MTNNVFNKLRYIFPPAAIPSLRVTQSTIQWLFGFQLVRYNCCPNSCVCYTGHYAEYNQCPSCKTDQYQSDSSSKAYYKYLPLIPRLRAMVASPALACRMQYRAKHHHDPNKVTDIFDGAHYQSLKETPISIADTALPVKFFSDPRDIALGLSLDGFCIFKKHSKTHGLSLSLITTSLLKSNFMKKILYPLESFLVLKSQPISTLFYGLSYKKWCN